MLRTLSRWLMSFALAVLALIAINLSVTTSPAEGKHAASLINCSGSIQACIDAANDGDTILIAAGRYTESLTLSKAVSLTGENRDTTIIHAIAGQRVLTVTGSTISNSVVISGLTFTGGSVDAGGGIYAEVPLDIQNSRFISNSATTLGGAIRAVAVSSADTDFIGNSAFGTSSGGAIAASDVRLFGGRFEHNINLQSGGGAVSAHTLWVSGAVFVSNTANAGGAVYVDQQASIFNAEFERNRAGDYAPDFGGGALYGRGTITISETRFISNSTSANGGALLAANQTTVSDVDFINNTAGGNGGAIFEGDWLTAGSLVMTSTNFLSNSATRGGGLYIIGTASIANAQFDNNIVTDLGGAINAHDGSLALTRTVVIHNNGSALYSENSPATIDDSHFEQNSGGVGGAVWMYYVGAIISHTNFISNSATLGGGGVTMINGRIVNSRFEGNTVQQNWGGGLYAMGTTFVTNTEFVSNTAQTDGGGAYFGNAEIYNSRFEGNLGHTGGGGGFFAFGLLLSNTDVISNYAGCSAWITDCGGGGTYTFNEAVVLNSRFERNFATTGSGGLFAHEALTITDGVFTSNEANTGLGGLFARGTVSMSNTDFISNTGGGAVLGGPSTIVGGHFTGNQGGGLGTDRDAIISGTTFVSNTSNIGGGLYANYTATLYNTRFEGNAASSYGGGLFAEHADIISGAEFINNTATTGGGATVGEMQFMTNTSFVGNVATQSGGGLWAGARSVSIANTLFSRNVAGTTGAAMSLSVDKQVTITFTTIASPTLVPVSAIQIENWIDGHVNIVDTVIASHTIAISNTDASVIEDYNLFFNNITNTLGVITGTHSLVGNPRFVDPLNGDYHLQFGSAAIDRGVDAGIYTDLDGNVRPHGAGFDIGAYEFMGGHYLWLPLIRK